jgi:hypothetical protein
MKTKNTAIALLAIGSVLYLTSANEKPLTQAEIAKGDDVSIKGVSRAMVIVGATLLIINLFSKQQQNG